MTSKSLSLVLAVIFLSPGLRAEFKAGAATCNITPPLGISLDGVVGQNPAARRIHDELYVRCLALDDGETRLAFAIVDSTVVSGSIMDAALKRLQERTGLAPENVIISATHSHSTPRALEGLKDDADFVRYLEDLAVAISDGVERALNNLAPAEIGWSSGDEPRHVRNRRWFVEESARIPDPFGEVGDLVRTNPGWEGLLKPAGPADPQVYVLAVRHADGRPLAVMANYGLHYVGQTVGGDVSADYFGMFADRIQERLGADRLDPPFVGIMTNGASGDVNARDYTSPPEKDEPYEKMRRIANDVAEVALQAMDSITYRRDVNLAAATKILDLKVRKPDAARLEWARENMAPEGTPLRLSRAQVYARETLALAEYPDIAQVKIRAFRIGELGIVAIPNEVFAETGLAVKESSPFSDTFVIGLANGYHGYLPSPQQHEWGGYETWPARSAPLELEAETHIRQASIRLLEELAP